MPLVLESPAYVATQPHKFSTKLHLRPLQRQEKRHHGGSGVHRHSRANQHHPKPQKERQEQQPQQEKKKHRKDHGIRKVWDRIRHQVVTPKQPPHEDTMEGRAENGKAKRSVSHDSINIKTMERRADNRKAKRSVSHDGIDLDHKDSYDEEDNNTDESDDALLPPLSEHWDLGGFRRREPGCSESAVTATIHAAAAVAVVVESQRHLCVEKDNNSNSTQPAEAKQEIDAQGNNTDALAQHVKVITSQMRRQFRMSVKFHSSRSLLSQAHHQKSDVGDSGNSTSTAARAAAEEDKVRWRKLKLDSHLAAADQMIKQFLTSVSLIVNKKEDVPGTTVQLMWYAVEDMIHPAIRSLFREAPNVRLSLSGGRRQGQKHRQGQETKSIHGAANDKQNHRDDSESEGDDDDCVAAVRDDVTPVEAALLLTWIDDMLKKVRHARKHHHVMCEYSSGWLKDGNDLILHYLKKAVSNPMQEMLARSLELSNVEDVRCEPETNIVLTTLPEQIGFFYHQVLEAAKQHLPTRFHEHVLAACNDQVSHHVGEIMVYVGTHWKDFATARFCAMINDSGRIADACEERNQMFTDYDLSRDGDNLVKDLSELSLHTTNFLCERMIHDLSSPQSATPVLTSVGSLAWELDANHSAMATTIATFSDFFRDVQEWLIADYYFPKVLHNCLDATLGTYIESFFSNTLQTGVLNASTVAARLNGDFLNLMLFFMTTRGIARYHGKGGFYTEEMIGTRLQIIRHIAAVIDPAIPPTDCIPDIIEVLKHFSSELDATGASAVVLHLAGLRKRHSATESVEWLEAIAKAKKEFMVQKQEKEKQEKQQRQQKHEEVNIRASRRGNTCPLDGEDRDSPLRRSFCSTITTAAQHYHFVVPDLRNSHFIHNLQPYRFDARLSGASCALMESSRQLLNSKGGGYKGGKQQLQLRNAASCVNENKNRVGNLNRLTSSEQGADVAPTWMAWFEQYLGESPTLSPVKDGVKS